MEKEKLIQGTLLAASSAVGPAAVGAAVTVVGTAALGIVLFIGPKAAYKYFKESSERNTNNDNETNSQGSEKETKEIKTIFIVGTTGAGKSTLANVVVGEEQKFKEVPGSTSGTQKIQIEFFDWEETKYRIIDTIGQGNVSELTNEEIEKRLEALPIDVKMNGFSQICVVFKDRFTNEQIKVFKWLKSRFNENELYPYITLVSTNFADFEDKEKCEEDIKKLLELKENKDITEIISNCEFIHINNPPTNISGKDKKRAERQNAINKEVRGIARECLLYHLKTRCKRLNPLRARFNIHSGEFNEEEIVRDWEQLENN